MIQVICPVCGAALEPQGAAWRCVQGHCFDVARQGYVNLLTVTQKHSRHPGDTREMVAARRAFLDAGWYAPIAKTLADLVRRFCPETASVLDAGCGEGYYLSQLGWVPERWGIDISRDAVRYAAVRDRSAHWLTATAAHLPFADGGFDCVLSMFALTAGAEFARVLRPGGIFVQVLAGQNHLPGLKSIIYPAHVEKEKMLHPALPGFGLLHTQTLRFSFSLPDAQSVHDLLYMTPHVWRITKRGAEALAQTAQLTDTAEVIFNIYGRQEAGNLLE